MNAIADQTTRQDVQGLRGVAILLVLVFHAGLPLPGGFAGVDVFFVISGYVITLSLIREWHQTSNISLSNFYWRRFRRLAPPLAAVIATVCVGFAPLLSPLGSLEKSAEVALGGLFVAANAVISRNYGGYFDSNAESNSFLHLWSLSVEEQFYLLFPVLLLLVLRVAVMSNAKRDQFVISMAASASLLSFWLANLDGIGTGSKLGAFLTGFYSPITRAWELGLGVLVALINPGLRRGWKAFSTLGLLAIGVAALLHSESSDYPGMSALVPTLGATAILYARAGGFGERILSNWFLRGIGEISYSLYLWHWPFVVVAHHTWPKSTLASVLASLVAFAPAWLSYKYLESRFRVPIKLEIWSRFRFILQVYAPAFVITSSITLSFIVGWLPADVRSARSTLLEDHVASGKCHGSGSFTVDIAETCLWNGGSAARPIYLVGDSNALHFSEAVIAAATRLDRPVYVYTAAGCPFSNQLSIVGSESRGYFAQVKHTKDFANCRAYAETVLSWLATAAKGDVIVSNFDQYWWDPSLGVVGPGKLEVTFDAGQKQARFRIALEDTVNQLQAFGMTTTLVLPVPNFRIPQTDWDPRTCSYLKFAVDECQLIANERLLLAYQGETRKTLTSIAHLSNSSVVDVWQAFCRHGECRTGIGSEWSYRDASHLTAAASRELASTFLLAINT